MVYGGLNELALFAGAGGGILGGHLLGWRTVCAVEYDCYAASVLLQRQNDGILQPFPIWDDVRTFDGKPWRGVVDVVSGGFPCQDISAAGKGAGINGIQSGLWSEMARIIGEILPEYVFVENSPLLTSRGLGSVLGDLAAMGYDAEWGVLGAFHAGAPHKRDRIWIVGNSRCDRWDKGRDDNREHVGSVIAPDGEHPGTMAHAESICSRSGLRQDGQEQNRNQFGNGSCHVPDTNAKHVYDTGFRAGTISQQQTATVPGVLSEKRTSTWWTTEPDMGRVAHGVASRVDRLKAIGNGQVPAVAELAWRMLAKVPLLRVTHGQHFPEPPEV